MIRVIDNVAQMQAFARKRRGEIALVPTMGYLHAGHASLMVEAGRLAPTVVASIFVNPTQFGAGEDLESYPRDLERDKEIAAEAGVEVIFAPSVSEMYPKGYQSYVNVEGLTDHLCGASRPGHFRGVTTVVAKLFNIVSPKVALFGRKDFQQLAVIRRMVADLNMDLEIVGMPTVREADGLAMSSRNARLSPADRERALCLHRALNAARAQFASGERCPERIREMAQATILAQAGAEIDYVELRDQESLEMVGKADARTLLALAVRIAGVRLIDNCIIGEEG